MRHQLHAPSSRLVLQHGEMSGRILSSQMPRYFLCKSKIGSPLLRRPISGRADPSTNSRTLSILGSHVGRQCAAIFLGGNMKQSNHLQQARTQNAEPLQIVYQSVAKSKACPANPWHRVRWPAPAKVEPRSAFPKLSVLEMVFNSAAGPCGDNGIRCASHGCVQLLCPSPPI